jgi:four helix bundle protein
MYLFSFEKLEVWNDARVLVKMIYEITAGFPASEKFGLINQMNRASVSVASNIAEGSARITANDKARFMHIAFGSLMELLNQLIIAGDFGWVSEEQMIRARSQVEKVANKLNALEKAYLSK